jgi:outer membrane protein TolC
MDEGYHVRLMPPMVLLKFLRTQFIFMKKFIVAAALLLTLAPGYGQNKLTLNECYERAEQNYPSIKLKELLQKTKQFSIENAANGNLPQITIAGQATYQSQVTQIPVEIPGVEPLSKDQFKIFGEISQTLYHGGVVKHQKQLEEVNGIVEEEKLAVELYHLRNRINDLFFGILLLQDQIAQAELVGEDIASGIKKTEAAIQNGVALKSSADVLRAELLRSDQRVIEFESTQQVYRDILALFINETIDAATIFERPQVDMATQAINRRELALFDYQKRSIEIQRSLLSARKKPRFELFVQSGYGRPALNMLENKFDVYYLGGARFAWQLSGLYNHGREKQILTLRQQSLDIQKETFLFNTGITSRQYQGEILKLERLIQVDSEIIELRTRVKETAAFQLEQGVMTSTDFVREVNAEDQARQNRVLHETQLLRAKANYQYNSGN